MGEVSVVVVNRNRRRELEACLRSLQQQRVEHQVVVVDNGSRDGSPEMVERLFPEVEVVRLGRNAGAAEGRNIGVEHASGKYIAFIDSDAVAHPAWLEELLRAMRAERRAAVCGSKVVDGSRLVHAGGRFTLIGAGVDLGLGEVDSERYSRRCYSAFACWAGAMVRRTAYESLGGLDEWFFVYHEEPDFCYRAWIAGWKVVYVPTSVVYHPLSSSLSPFREYMCQRNRLGMVLKNYELRNVLLGVGLNLAYSGVVVARHLAGLKPELAGAVVRGYLSVLASLPELLRKRRRVQGMRRLGDGELCSLGLMLTLSEALEEVRRLGGVRS